MYGGFRIHPAPLPPNGTVTRKKQPPSICSFPAVARNHSQTSPDPTARVWLGAGPRAGPPRCGGAQGARDSQFWERAPVLGFSGSSSGCRAPLASFPREPDSFELNARSFR